MVIVDVQYGFEHYCERGQRHACVCQLAPAVLKNCAMSPHPAHCIRHLSIARDVIASARVTPLCDVIVTRLQLGGVLAFAHTFTSVGFFVSALCQKC